MQGNDEPEELLPLSFEELAQKVQEFKMLHPKHQTPQRITFTPEDHDRFKRLCAATERTKQSAFGSFFMEIQIESSKHVPDGFFLMDGKPYKWNQ